MDPSVALQNLFPMSKLIRSEHLFVGLSKWTIRCCFEMTKMLNCRIAQLVCEPNVTLKSMAVKQTTATNLGNAGRAVRYSRHNGCV